MRSCDEVLELISAALDGPLADAEQAALDEHLAHCPACSALWEELRDLHAATVQLDDVPAPAGFADRVMDAIAAAPTQEQNGQTAAFPEKKKRARTPWKGWTAAAAAVAVVVLGAVTLTGPFGVGSQNTSADSAASVQTADDNGSSLDEGAEDGSSIETYSAAPREAAEDVPESVSEDTSEQEFAEEAQLESGDAAAGEDAAFYTITDLQGSSCGTLILTGALLPAGLESYEYTEDEDGNRIYRVPTDYFFTYVEDLQTQQTSNFLYTFEQTDADPDAEYGLIVVEVP